MSAIYIPHYNDFIVESDRDETAYPPNKTHVRTGIPDLSGFASEKVNRRSNSLNNGIIPKICSKTAFRR
jgi:hypothetical protein